MFRIRVLIRPANPLFESRLCNPLSVGRHNRAAYSVYRSVRLRTSNQAARSRRPSTSTHPCTHLSSLLGFAFVSNSPSPRKL